MAKNNYVKICPKCGNINLPSRTSFTDMLMPTQEKCNKCNYAGLFPEININDIEDFRKSLKETN